MSLIGWFRGLFRPDPQKQAAAQQSRDERLRAQREVQAARSEAGVSHQFHPPIPPGGFGP